MPSLTIYHPSIEHAIDGWIAEKRNTKCGSEKTAKAYRETITSFRQTLQRGGLDLDTEETYTVTQVAAIWAALRAPARLKKDGTESRRFAGEVSSATYNQRLAIVSSFYAYLQKQAKLLGSSYQNPIEDVERRKVQAYADAAPLDLEEVQEQLQQIDTETKQGKRDYALLAVGLMTGRRASEIASLRMEHVKIARRKVTLHFDHCKGAKKMRDTLDEDTAEILLDYLHAVYGAELFRVTPEAPVWVSFSPRNPGQALTIFALADIAKDRLGESKFHALRHTFAVESEKAGAPISDIAARLGHTDEKITHRYLKQTRSAENPHASKLAARYGIKKHV